MADKTRVVIYARVSTSTQDYNHQLKSIRDYAKKNSYIVLKEFKEKISGAKRIDADKHYLNSWNLYARMSLIRCLSLSAHVCHVVQQIS